MVLTVRIWCTHSVLSTAPGDCQVEMPFSSSTPTVFSHSRRPYRAPTASSTCTFAIPLTAFLTVLLSVSTTVLRAQLRSAFHAPQPPTYWRDQPDSGERMPP